MLALSLGSSGAAYATSFGIGDFVSYDQDDWGSSLNTAGQLLVNHFVALYPNGIEIGVVGAAGDSVAFDTTDAVFDYLPATGPAGPLLNDYLDPFSAGNEGVFGGYVLSLQIDVDLSDAGALGGSAGISFGDLILVDTGTTAYNGLTVRHFLTEMNNLLGGVPLVSDYDSVANLTFDLTRAFHGGTPSQFAQDHLALSDDLTTPVPEPSTMVLVGLGALGLRGRLRRVRVPRGT